MIDKNSEQWRMECEARHVLRLGGLWDRRAYLDLIEAERGVEARKALEAVIGVEWNKRKLHQGSRNE